MGNFEIPSEYSNRIFSNPMGYQFSHENIKVSWEFKKSHEILSYSHRILKYPMRKTNNHMGKFNFPWEFYTFVIYNLIISPARCKQVKSRVVFEYAEPTL